MIGDTGMDKKNEVKNNKLDGVCRWSVYWLMGERGDFGDDKAVLQKKGRKMLKSWKILDWMW